VCARGGGSEKREKQIGQGRGEKQGVYGWFRPIIDKRPKRPEGSMGKGLERRRLARRTEVIDHEVVAPKEQSENRKGSNWGRYPSRQDV